MWVINTLFSLLSLFQGYDARMFKKLLDFGKKHVESKLVPYLSLYPEAKSSEYMYKGG